jgi:hypothetical protein
MGDVDVELAALKSKIDTLRIIYAVLFFGSLGVLAMQFVGHVAGLTIPWIILLGGAVTTRLIRQSMVNRYNTLLANGRPGPMV